MEYAKFNFVVEGPRSELEEPDREFERLGEEIDDAIVVCLEALKVSIEERFKEHGVTCKATNQF